MSKIFKVAVLAMALGIICAGSAIAQPPDPIPIDIDIIIGEVLYLDAQARNISNDAPAAISFNTAVTIADPWRTSDQYIYVEYTANTATWGVRIITDNETAWPAMAGNKLACGEPYDTDTTIPPDGIPDVVSAANQNWGDGDEILSFAGLVNTSALINPTMRASLGWQVYADKVVKPANPTDDSFGGNPYSSPWAYLSDKSNHVMADDGTRKKDPATGADVLAGDEKVVTGTTADGEYIFSYSLIGYGGVGQALAQHPAADPKVANDNNNPTVTPGKDGAGKYDVAVYLAARFASTDYSGAAPVDFVLPGGSYSAKLYVEMLLE